MGRKEIELSVLQEVVADLPLNFTSKDVSNDLRLKSAYPHLSKERNYNAYVGGALSDHNADLGIEWTGYDSHRDTSRWHKMGLPGDLSSKTNYDISRQFVSQPIPEMIKNVNMGIGPQSDSDKTFAKRMRLHQSWYRSCVMHLPFGTGPTKESIKYHGNMLTPPDGAAGRNFLAPAIFEVANERLALGGRNVEEYRLLHNMLSSQPMCFNLFGPLVKDYNLAQRLLATLVPEKIAEVTWGVIEWVPPEEDYLHDDTSFDAFFKYRTIDGRLAGLGIETKLSEPFSQKEYDQPEYRRWMQTPDSPWRTAAWNDVQAKSHNQLWRDHLLAVALHLSQRSPYDITRLMLVRHPKDKDCARVTAGYKQLLRDGDDTLLDMPLDRLVERWLSVVSDGPQQLAGGIQTALPGPGAKRE